MLLLISQARRSLEEFEPFLDDKEEEAEAGGRPTRKSKYQEIKEYLERARRKKRTIQESEGDDNSNEDAGDDEDEYVNSSGDSSGEDSNDSGNSALGSHG